MQSREAILALSFKSDFCILYPVDAHGDHGPVWHGADPVAQGLRRRGRQWGLQHQLQGMPFIHGHHMFKIFALETVIYC